MLALPYTLARTISFILYFTNWRAHSKLVISMLLSSPPDPGGCLSVLTAPTKRDTSTRNVVIVCCLCALSSPISLTRSADTVMAVVDKWIQT